MGPKRSGVAVVVSGGGARGAYEAGVLSVLLPALKKDGLQPDIFLGTSVGAINAVAFAAMSHLDVEEASEAALKLWRDVRFSSVFRVPMPGASRRGKERRASAPFDTTPLECTLGTKIGWDRLHRNVAEGRVSVGITATAWSTRRTAVFLEQPPTAGVPPTDEGRAIDYLPTTLTPRHILGSAANPAVFPAVLIDQPPAAADWYTDGGVRMNTPLKPAIAMGAKQIVVVATDPGQPPPERTLPSAEWAPTASGGAAQILYAVLADRMLEDLRTLARKNAVSTDASEPGPNRIGWLFAGPPAGVVGPLAQLAGEVLQGKAPGQRPRSVAVNALRRTAGRWVANDPGRLELLTHLLFDPEFLEGSIALGRSDATRSLDHSGAPIWQLTDLVPAARQPPP